jgi:hypothetical protein
MQVVGCDDDVHDDDKIRVLIERLIEKVMTRLPNMSLQEITMELLRRKTL